MTTDLVPQRPKQLSSYAELCLEALSHSSLANRISLGGAVGLMHYHEYRPTHDVDAWWISTTSQQDRRQVEEVLESSLRPFGDVRTRRWGDVTSIELRDNNIVVFSFQIAERSAQLEALRSSPWRGVLLDSLTDLVASKMVALIERGAPRDFRDIYELCQVQLTSVDECWRLWHQRQELVGSDTDLMRAKIAVQLHLERIEKHRPLVSISEFGEREKAREVRSWFREVFTSAKKE
jgi:hypothetical protein